MAGPVTDRDLARGIEQLALQSRLVCAHASLSSFGELEGGADTIVDAFLALECTLVVPTFSFDAYLIAPPEHMRPSRNGWDYEAPVEATADGRIYTTDVNDISPEMGALAAGVLARDGRVRGNNPLASFAAVGPEAAALVEPQRPLDVFPTLRLLAARDGVVLLMGVGLPAMTLLHVAEEKAGRRLFRRWALATDGLPMEVEVAGCSNGFDSFERVLAPLAREAAVGESRWRAFPARETLAAATSAIEEDPELTRCDDPACLRCRDMIAGGISYA